MTDSLPKPVSISPAIAWQWLAFADHRNPISWHHVACLSDAMRNGAFHNRGAPIQFEGQTLANGHHRLLAVTRYGSPVTMLVSGDPPKKEFDSRPSAIVKLASWFKAVWGRKPRARV